MQPGRQYRVKFDEYLHRQNMRLSGRKCRCALVGWQMAVYGFFFFSLPE